MAEGKFATLIACMDGRVQVPLSEWMREHLQVDYVDTITEAGPEKIVTQGTEAQIAAIREKIEVSVNLHGSANLVMSAHHDCGGNPVSKEQHLKELAQSVEAIQSWEYPVRIMGVWVNEKWEVELIHDKPYH